MKLLRHVTNSEHWSGSILVVVDTEDGSVIEHVVQVDHGVRWDVMKTDDVSSAALTTLKRTPQRYFLPYNVTAYVDSNLIY